ncbi:hypothetical protein AAG906_005601 [Vitis piasezkii]
MSESRVGLILQSQIGELIEQVIHFSFFAFNNETKYETILVELDLALILVVAKLEIKNEWIIRRVPREENRRVDALVEITATLPINETIMLPVYFKVVLSITPKPVCNTSQAYSRWMLDIIKYHQTREVSKDGKQAHKLCIQAAHFTLINDQLYKRSFEGPYLKCLSELEVKYVITELHEGVSLNPVTSPCPFTWGMDIVRLLPIGVAQKKFLLVATDYFSKWVEAKAYDSIKDKDVSNAIFRTFCSKLNIKNLYSTPHYPQNNGQVEATNKTLLNALKKQLEGAKEMATPFTLTYRMEAIILTKIGMLIAKIVMQDQSDNDEELIKQLDWADKMQ